MIFVVQLLLLVFQFCIVLEMSFGRVMTTSIKHASTTLFVASRADPASLNLFHSLVTQPIWSRIGTETDDGEVTMLAQNRLGEKFFLWLQSEPLLRLDHVDRLFASRFQEQAADGVSDVVFLSKHSAKSGTRSLTVHPIGVPWLDDVEHTGGRPRRCVPPHPSIAGLYRRVDAEVKTQGLTERFQVTMEATHHGPYAEVPCCFVEIGSTEVDWDDREAGAIWAKCLV